MGSDLLRVVDTEVSLGPAKLDALWPLFQHLSPLDSIFLIRSNSLRHETRKVPYTPRGPEPGEQEKRYQLLRASLFVEPEVAQQVQ